MPGQALRLRRSSAHVRLLIARLAAACALIASVARGADFPGRTASLLAPADGARVAESAARFAFALPPGVREGTLIVSHRPFDPTGWVEIPQLDDLVAIEHARGVMTLRDARVSIVADTPLWWAVATRDANGAMRVSEVRSLVALRGFANRVAAPLVPLAGATGPIALDERARSRLAGVANAATAGRRPPLRLGAGYTFAIADGMPRVSDALSSAHAPREEGADARAAYLVQFAAPPSADERNRIVAAGGTIVTYVPEQAFLVRMSDAARARLAADASAPGIIAYEPAFKVSPLLDLAQSASTGCTALVFPDGDLAAARAALVALGATDLESSDNGINRLLRFRLAGESVPAVAALPQVEWIEPTPHYELNNDMAQWVVQSAYPDERPLWDHGLFGQGQVVMTSDSGVRTAHNQFVDPLVPLNAFGDYPTHRKIIAYKLGSLNPGVVFGDHGTASFHGTHTAGTICGNDDPTANASPRDGMAKAAKLYFMDISGPTLGGSVEPFPDLNDLFEPSYVGNAGGAARISSNSWGSSVHGEYLLDCMQTDQFMWRHPDYLISFSNGNAGTAGSVNTPAAAKNTIGMGACQNGVNENFIFAQSSRGPTKDGRLKPTLMAPGQPLYSAYGGTTSTYAALSGTSMASPSGAGVIALMREYLTEGWYPNGVPVAANGFTPSAALLKAIAINGAMSMYVYDVPDMNVGWGRINGDNSLYFPGDDRKLLLVDNHEGLIQGQQLEYQVHVADAQAPLNVTLCWTDFPGNPASAVQLVNDLDLTVTNGVKTYLGNVWDNGESTLGGRHDSLNVEECVRLTVPDTGMWTVRVSAPVAPLGPQPFGLCVSGSVGNGAGALALDRAEYGSKGTLQLQVVDANATGPVRVAVRSTTESVPDSVTLSGGNGIYTGSIVLTPAPANHGDGLLSVSNGDLVTVVYADASPALSLVAHATVSFETPVITEVRATSAGSLGTIVSWTTDRPATSRVRFGGGGTLTSVADSSGFSQQHAVLLTGLAPAALYDYDVESESFGGDGARDSLGGRHYQFTAPDEGQVLLVLGDPAFADASTWTQALDALGVSYDLWSGDAAIHPDIGDLSHGLRSYRAVLWQVGLNQLPPFSSEQRAAIDSLILGGGRLAVIGHDIAYGLGSTAAPGYSAATAAWLANRLKTRFLGNPIYWTREIGLAGDPISSAYTSGIPYFPVGDDLAGNEVGLAPVSDGVASFCWQNNEISPDNCAVRWESAAPNGAGGSAAWAGQPSRLVALYWEWTRLSSANSANDPVRTEVLDRTLAWLFGRERPQVTLTTPNGYEMFVGDVVPIAWTSHAAAGLGIASQVLEYSLDDGDSWLPLAIDPVDPNACEWNLTGVPNSQYVRVRVRLADDGTPQLAATDASDAAFALYRPGGDVAGPVLVAGSFHVSPNPIVQPGRVTLAATLSDLATGGSEVVAAEWSSGATPAAPGTGTPLGGSYGAEVADVLDSLDAQVLASGIRTLWVRGRDSAGRWGPAASLVVHVNSGLPLAAIDQPVRTFLAGGRPNPCATRTELSFGLARAGRVELALFDTQGRRVRTFVAGDLPAGLHATTWNRADEHGQRVRPGVYCCRLIANGERFERKLVVIE